MQNIDSFVVARFINRRSTLQGSWNHLQFGRREYFFIHYGQPIVLWVTLAKATLVPPKQTWPGCQEGDVSSPVRITIAGLSHFH